MAARSNAVVTEPAERVLVIGRLFDSPRELVFDAFTRPKHLMSWWGPRGCKVISCEADLKPGGTWRITMQSPRVRSEFTRRYPMNAETGSGRSQARQSSAEVAASDYWIVERQRGVYQEVVKPERLVFTYAFEDDAGRPLHQTLFTLSFADEEGRTKLTLHQAIFEKVSVRDDHARGWTEALEHLAEYLMLAH